MTNFLENSLFIFRELSMNFTTLHEKKAGRHKKIENKIELHA